MARDSFIKFHLEQAERYSRALSDPMYVSEYSARFLAQNITYHRSMADWYMSEPERPEEEYNRCVRVNDNGVRCNLVAVYPHECEFNNEADETGIRDVVRAEKHLVEKESGQSSGAREDTDDSERSNSNTDDVERTVT